jgi:hypothetical protein
MNTRIRILSLVLAAAVVLGVVGPVSAQTGSGTGTITCDGDGVVVLSGDFTSVSATVEAGALVHNKPGKGTITAKSGTSFVKYISGDVVIYVGTGSGSAKNVKGLKLTLSGANGHIEVTGTGKMAVRGEGWCTTGSGKTITWTSTVTNVSVTP